MKEDNQQPLFWRAASLLIRICSGIAAIALFTLMLAVCLDVVMRRFGKSIVGVYDIVCICGAVSFACILPATSAAKGHIAIEYFFHKLGPRLRKLADILVHGGMAFALAVASAQCVRFGVMLLFAGECTSTLQIPVFWIPWVVAVGCMLSALVSVYHLANPGKEMMRI